MVCPVHTAGGRFPLILYSDRRSAAKLTTLQIGHSCGVAHRSLPCALVKKFRPIAVAICIQRSTAGHSVVACVHSTGAREVAAVGEATVCAVWCLPCGLLVSSVRVPRLDVVFSPEGCHQAPYLLARACWAPHLYCPQDRPLDFMSGTPSVPFALCSPRLCVQSTPARSPQPRLPTRSIRRV